MLEPPQAMCYTLSALYVSLQTTVHPDQTLTLLQLRHPSTPYPHHPYNVFIKVSVMKMPLTAKQCLLTKHRTWHSPSALIPPPV